MITLPLGLIAFVFVLIGAAGDVKVRDYIVIHSIIVVFGGTFAVAAICTPLTVSLAMIKNIFSLFQGRRTMLAVKAELMKLATNRSQLSKSSDPLIHYAIGLWQKGVDQGTFIALLSQYRDKVEHEDAESLAALQAIAKYPPALGMVGTVMGMITLFANLGTSDKSALGPSLATAMTATFYGLVLTQGLLSPLADRISVEVMYRKKYFGYVYEILNLINHREPVNMIEEEIAHREAA